MATKKKAKKAEPESPAAAKRRHIDTLARAHMAYFNRVHEASQVDPDTMDRSSAEDYYSIIRTAVYAAMEGRQSAKNIAEAMDRAVKSQAGKVRRRRG